MNTETNINQEEIQPKKMRKLKDFSDGSKRQKTILSVLSVALGILFWYIITLIPTINTFLASPKQVIDELIVQINANGRYFKDIWASLQRVLVGFSIAFVIAIPVAFLMGWYPKLRALVEPWIQFFRTIPPIALIPMVILAMGLTEAEKYTIIFIAAFLVMVVTIYQGIKEVDKTTHLPEFTFPSTWVASVAWMQENPAVVQKFINALAKASKYRAEHIEQSLRWAEEICQVNEGTFKADVMIAPSADELYDWFKDFDGRGYTYMKALYDSKVGNVPAGNRVKTLPETMNFSYMLKALSEVVSK